MKILVLGASGMLGHVVFRLLLKDPRHEVVGTVRTTGALLGRDTAPESLIGAVDVERSDALTELFLKVRPKAVINCVGLVKQLAAAQDPLCAIPINAVLPHRLAQLCRTVDARLIHISTDCVFSGSKGRYIETDVPDAPDLYGRSKLLGEVDYPHAVTLRTSIIGPELAGNHGLVGWFLSQVGPVKGFRRAIFSGLPTVELARVICDFVLPRTELRGVYHVASEPIDKFHLLRSIGAAYGKTNEIIPDDNLVIDRSLIAQRFAQATGYEPPSWLELVQRMREFA